MVDLYVSVTPLLVPVNKAFDYAVPEKLRGGVTLGSMVVVPFGKRKIFGIVVRVADSTKIAASAIKPVEDIVDDFKRVPQDLMRLCLWISRMYLCPLNTVLETVFPFHRRMSRYGIDKRAFHRLREKTVLEKNVALSERALAEALEDDFAKYRKAPVQRRLLSTLAREGGHLTARRANRLAGSSMQTVKALEKKGLLHVDYLPRAMSPAGEAGIAEKHHILIPEQQAAFDRIARAMEDRRHEIYLLHGITGSGKTEVYMHAVRRCIELGRRVIILVPEIALATQIISRFLRRFLGRVAVWHSKLSMTERLYEWMRISTGEIDIVIGARSAIFAPMENIGMIVVDEEHEPAYKQESAPRYHARETAVRRGKLLGCPVVLGSATPSLESMYHAREKKYKYMFLTSRIGASELPEITIIDMRKQKTKRTTSTFSPPMVEAIRANIEKGEQTMVFLNHRGYSQYLQCFTCGNTITCNDCSVSMKYHKAANILLCHMCGYRAEVPERCPECNSRALRRYGIGTERIYNQLRRAFKEARIERMDRDTTSRKGEYQRIIEACESGEVDILVGTQMIAKGLDFAGVTLVCVISADGMINMPDFRSSERTYQLLTQVAGRAGRRSEPGRVLVQTLMPSHIAVRSACNHDPDTFYESELAMRKEALYPPFTFIINFLSMSEDEQKAFAAASLLSDKLQAAIKKNNSDKYFGILGPAPAYFFKLSGRYRYMLFLRGTSIREMHSVTNAAIADMPAETQKLITVDVHPQNML